MILSKNENELQIDKVRLIKNNENNAKISRLLIKSCSYFKFPSFLLVKNAVSRY